MIKFLIVTAFVICGLTATAQNRYVQKLYAYKEVRRSQDDKKPSYSNYLIFIELPKSDTPIWDTAVIGNDLYSVHSSLIEESTTVVGERKKDGRLIKIKRDPVNNLWKLELDMTGEKFAGTISGEETVLLKGAFKNRRISSMVRSIVELTSP